ncbi:MAG: hypothetical protein Q4D02_04610 [Clostridia bacterium]|nr:hypothetical protein [Clostridia bacterium]
MKALVVSYVDGITEEIKEVLKKYDCHMNIDTSVDICHARHHITMKEYDILVIDMMTQFDDNYCIGPLLKPALDFLSSITKSSKINKPKKVFALFDECETGDKGKDIVLNLGYKIANFSFASMQWRRELLKYMEDE